jgi:deoxyribose-phosphate aldolase
MSKLETETSAFKTIEAYKSAASEIGLVLKRGDGLDSGDYPRHVYTNLRYIRRVDALGKEHMKIIRNMIRQLVTVKDEKGRLVKKEYLTYVWESSGQ